MKKIKKKEIRINQKNLDRNNSTGTLLLFKEDSLF